jgi:CubicO group peptidase (beta-lactamase class C family)
MFIKPTKTNRLFIFLAFFLLIAQTAPAQVSANKQIAAKTDEYMKASVKFDQFSGSILIARNGSPIVSRGYGMANYQLNAPNTPQTVFRIASLTKQFTALAVMQLQERGKLNVNDAICKHLEDCPSAWQSVTIRRLLTHTSGIPNFSSLPDWDDKLSIQPFTKTDFVKVFRDLPLLFAPGENFRYSNSGYYLLGLIIESASGETYQDFLKKNIFAPLGMKHTGLYEPRPLTPNLATGYYWSLNSYVNAPYHDSTGSFSNGGLISTTNDLLLWDQALYTEKLVSRKSLDEIFTPGKRNYGYGWIIEKRFNRNSMGHSGSFNGFSSFILRFPDERLTVVVLSNSDEASATKVANNLAAIVFGEKYALPLPKISDVLAAKIVEKDIESALRLYQELKKTAAERYDFREQWLDSLGWDLVENKRLADALEIFKLAVQEFPKSPNAYDSLGEIYLIQKNYDSALANFKKFLELDAQNSHAQEMVKKVEDILKNK